MVAPLIIGAIAAAAALFVGSGIALPKIIRNRKAKVDNSGEKKIQKLDTPMRKEEEEIKKEVEKDFEKDANSEEPKGSEKDEEKQLIKEAGAEKIEEDIEQVDREEEKIEKKTEEDASELVTETKKIFKLEKKGGKATPIIKKENKLELKAEKHEAKLIEAEEEAEHEIIKELESVLTILATTKQLAKDLVEGVNIETQDDKRMLEVGARIQNLSYSMRRYKGYAQLNVQTQNWVKNSMLPLVWQDIEAKVHQEIFEEHVNKSMDERIKPMLQVIKSATGNYETHENKLENMEKLEFKDGKQSIKDLEKFIKTKVKELNKIRKKAKSQHEHNLVVDLQKDIKLMEAYRDRMNQSHSEIEKTLKVMDKNKDRAKSMIRMLKRYESILWAIEKLRERKNDKIKSKVKSLEETKNESKMVIEEFYTTQTSFENIAVKTMEQIKKFFKEYGETMDDIAEYHETTKSLVSLCVRLAYNERSLLFLLQGVERAQAAVDQGTKAIIEMSVIILKEQNAQVAILKQWNDQLGYSENKMKKLEADTTKLQQAAAFVQGEVAQAQQAIDRETALMRQVKDMAVKEESWIRDTIDMVAHKFVKRMKGIDEKYVSPVDQYNKQQAESREASNRDYKLAA